MRAGREGRREEGRKGGSEEGREGVEKEIADYSVVAAKKKSLKR